VLVVAVARLLLVPAVRVVRVAVVRVEVATVPGLLELSILVVVAVAVVPLILAQPVGPVLLFFGCQYNYP